MKLIPLLICVVLAIASHTFGSVIERIYYIIRIEVDIKDAPFMATIRSDQGPYCGASIINSQYLVTAAHCVDAGSLLHRTTSRAIFVGTSDIDKYKGKKYEIEKVFKHPKYNRTYVDYDVAVIKLKQKLVFDKTIKPIQMVNKNFVVPDGTIVETMGFGYINDYERSNQLLKVKIPIFNHNNCNKILPLPVTDRMICAGGHYHEDSCHGDSGGPLIYNNQLLGIVSWGHGCGIKGYPGVYSSIPNLRDFVDQVVKTTRQNDENQTQMK